MSVEKPVDVVLASASPRRHELMSLIIDSFRVVPSRFDEEEVPDELGPVEHVRHCALMKARDVASVCPRALVIGADTVVVIDNVILGKPRNAANAAEMLRRLGGRTHQVYSGIAVVGGSTEAAAVECTNVTFRPLTEHMISRYVDTGEPFDKAGAYAIQGRGSVLVERIEGCYFNVVGLPVYRLSRLLEEFGIMPLFC